MDQLKCRDCDREDIEKLYGDGLCDLCQAEEDHNEDQWDKYYQSEQWYADQRRLANYNLLDIPRY